IHRGAPTSLLSRQRASVGKQSRTATLRSCLIPISAPVWSNLPVGLYFLRGPGTGVNRQPWHPAVGGSGRWDRQRFRAGAFLPEADGVLVGRQRFCHSGSVLGGGRARDAAGL